MPRPSRSSRAGRTPGGRFAASAAAAIGATHDTVNSTSRRSIGGPRSVGKPNHDFEDDADFEQGRVAKRRKLEVRGPRQQTLHAFLNGHLSRPPSKVTVSQPHGQLIETVNGVRNTLDIVEDQLPSESHSSDAPAQLPPPDAPVRPAYQGKKVDKRTLRSQDEGPRLKSELATYFPNYEEVILDAPHEPEFITVDSTIYIIDDASKQTEDQTPSPTKSAKSIKGTPSATRQRTVDGAQTQGHPLRALHNAPTLDFSPVARNLPERPEDPLTDDAFSKSHKRAERKEKQLRNIEREHAMHEKVQLDRLLDGLLGHDWLRVLGVTGVTEGEAKKFEPKRYYFIAEVRALVDKFKQWKDEEKRQRLEKEAALAAERDMEEGDGEDEEDDADEDEDAEIETEVSSIEPPSSDLNASAARQLQQETVSAVKSFAAVKPKGEGRYKACAPPDPIPYRPPSPMLSFYPSRHLREAALKKTRSSRNITAFGHALPEMEERGFELPREYITKDVLRASARERRRRNRESVANASSTSA